MKSLSPMLTRFWCRESRSADDLTSDHHGNSISITGWMAPAFDPSNTGRVTGEVFLKLPVNVVCVFLQEKPNDHFLLEFRPVVNNLNVQRSEQIEGSVFSFDEGWDVQLSCSEGLQYWQFTNT
jgi:hypothetical protein